MVVKPKASPVSPMPERMKPTVSSGGTVSSRMSSMYFVASQKPMMPIGMLIQKIQRQWK